MGRGTSVRLASVLVAGATLVAVIALDALGGGLVVVPAGSVAGAAPLPSQVETTVATTAVPSVEAVASTIPASTDSGTGEGSGQAAAVGDPAADRRIRRIVLILCGVAAAVLITTILFWRATRPVPRALEGLRAFGSRSSRRRAAAADAPPAPPGIEPQGSAVVGGAVAAPSPSDALAAASARPSRPAEAVAAGGVEPREMVQESAPPPSSSDGLPHPAAPAAVGSEEGASVPAEVVSDEAAPASAPPPRPGASLPADG